MSTVVQQGLAFIRYSADGSTSNFPIPFDYLFQEDIKATVNGEEVTFTWLNESEIQLDEMPSINDIVFIRRETSQDERLVNFQAAGQLREKTLDLDSDQLFNLTQEALDWRALTPTFDPALGGVNAQGDRIVNLGPGINPTDAVNKAQLDAMADVVNNAAEVAVLAAEAAQTAQGAAEQAVSDAQAQVGLATAQVGLATAQKDLAVIAKNEAQAAAELAQEYAESINPEEITVAQRFELIDAMQAGDLAVLTDVLGVTKVAPVRADGSATSVATSVATWYKRLALSGNRYAVLRCITSNVHCAIYQINPDLSVTVGSNFTIGTAGGNPSQPARIDAVYESVDERVTVVYTDNSNANLKYLSFDVSNGLVVTEAVAQSTGPSIAAVPTTLKLGYQESTGELLVAITRSASSVIELYPMVYSLGDFNFGSEAGLFMFIQNKGVYSWDVVSDASAIHIAYTTTSGIAVASLQMTGLSVNFPNEVYLNNANTADTFYLKAIQGNNRVDVLFDDNSLGTFLVPVSKSSGIVNTMGTEAQLDSSMILQTTNMGFGQVTAGRLVVVMSDLIGSDWLYRTQFVDIASNVATAGVMNPSDYGFTGSAEIGNIMVHDRQVVTIYAKDVDNATGVSVQLVRDSQGLFRNGNMNADGVILENGLLGETKKVALKGQVADVFSGLILGAEYFIQSDGSLQSIPSDLLLGRAVSDKAIMLYPIAVPGSEPDMVAIKAANLASLLQLSPRDLSDGWVPFTPTGTMTTNTTYTGAFRRTGRDTVQCWVKVHFDGVPNSTTLTVTSLPFTIDTTKLPKLPQDNGGAALMNSNGQGGVTNTVGWHLSVYAISSSVVKPLYLLAAGTYAGITQADPVTIAANSSFRFHFECPVTNISNTLPLTSSRLAFGNTEGQGIAPWILVSTGGSDANRRMMMSTDGDHWNQVSLPTGEPLSCAYYNPGQGIWIALASSGTNRVKRSFDGFVWTNDANNIPNLSWQGMTGHSAFVYAVASDTGSNALVESFNGTYWSTLMEVTYGGFSAITRGFQADGTPVFIAVRSATGGPGPAMRKIGLGGTWDEITIADRAGQFQDIAWFNGKFVATNSNGYCYVSEDDGDTWTRSVDGYALLRLAGGEDSNFIIGSSGAYLYYSRDGMTWKGLSSGEFYDNRAYYPMAFGAQRFVVVDRNASNPNSFVFVSGRIIPEE